MRRLATVVAVVMLLIIGGGLTAELIAGDSINSLFIRQSSIPDASTMATAPWQAEQLLLFIGFILFNLIGMAVTIMIVMWFLHRGVAKAKAQESSRSS